MEVQLEKRRETEGQRQGWGERKEEKERDIYCKGERKKISQ